MSLKNEAVDLAQCFIGDLAKLPSDRDSSWVTSVDAAKAAGVSEDQLRLVIRRHRFRAMLEKSGINCSYHGEYFYVYRELFNGDTR